jgi:hypothetical protein
MGAKNYTLAKRTGVLTNIISYALRDCFTQHPEWFSSGNAQAIEQHVLTTAIPVLKSTLLLSCNDGFFACMKRIIKS